MSVDDLKTKRLRNLLKQVKVLNSRMSFEDFDSPVPYSAIRYHIPEELRQKQWPLASYTVLEYYAKKPRDRYVGLFKKMFGEVEKTAFDSDVELKFTCIEEYMLKLAICGGR